MAEEDKTPQEEPARKPKAKDEPAEPQLNETDMSVYKNNKNAPKPYNFGEEQRARR